MRTATVVLLLLVAAAWAQYAPQPQQFSLVANNAGQIFHIYRDGPKALVDMEMPPGDGHPKPIHMRSLVTVATGAQLTWDLLDPSIPCGRGTASGWNDPFANYDQVMQSASGPPREVGKETLNGFATTVYDIPADGMTGKMWRENTYGMVVKFTVAPPGGQPESWIDVKEFKVGKPDASLFVPPARCGAK